MVKKGTKGKAVRASVRGYRRSSWRIFGRCAKTARQSSCVGMIYPAAGFASRQVRRPRARRAAWQRVAVKSSRMAAAKREVSRLLEHLSSVRVHMLESGLGCRSC